MVKRLLIIFVIFYASTVSAFVTNETVDGILKAKGVCIGPVSSCAGLPLGDLVVLTGITAGAISSQFDPVDGTITTDNSFICAQNNVNCFIGTDNLGSSVTLLTVDASNLIHLGDNGHGFKFDAGVLTTALFTVNSITKLTVNSTGIAIGSDNSVATMARESLNFETGGLSTLVTATNFDCTKLVKAITVENGTGTSLVDTSCSSGSVLKVFDCGTSAPNNAACTTAVATVTLSTTAGTAVAATINTANVAAGHYLCGQITTAGTGCLALDASLDLMARPQ